MLEPKADFALTCRNHRVWTATPAAPRTTPLASLNCTKMRLVAGRKAMAPRAVPKIPKVGVAFALIVVDTEAAGGPKHWPEVGFV